MKQTFFVISMLCFLTLPSISQDKGTIKTDTLSDNYMISLAKKQIGRQAPEWTLMDTEGKTHKSSDYKGKLLLIEFLSTNCGVCAKAGKEISEIELKYKLKNFAVIGIFENYCNFFNCDIIKDFNRIHKLSYLTLANGLKVSKEFGVVGDPTFFLIDKKGKIIYAQVGYSFGVTKKEITEIIDASL